MSKERKRFPEGRKVIVTQGFFEGCDGKVVNSVGNAYYVQFPFSAEGKLYLFHHDYLKAKKKKKS